MLSSATKARLMRCSSRWPLPNEVGLLRPEVLSFPVAESGSLKESSWWKLFKMVLKRPNQYCCGWAVLT